MKVKVLDTQLTKVKDVELNEAIFGIKPRADILARVVHWQLAKRQSGTHDTKERGEVSGSTKKIVRQKGSGGARHGSKRATQFRTGGIVFGPQPRSHAYDLPKKVRKLGLKMALAAKYQAEELIVVDSFDKIDPKLKSMKALTEKLATQSVLLIDAQKNDSVLRASANLIGVDHLPMCGANVYDILRKEKLVITVPALKALEERLK